MASSNAGKPIVIAPYDPAWPSRFERARDEMLRACGRDAFVRIEHIGSTAVPGLGAKPIIDMMPGLRSLDDAPPIVAAVQTLGYDYVAEFERPNAFDVGMPSRRYFRRDVDGVRAFHVHMVEVGSDFWADQLLFRNYLRAFPAETAAYEALKRDLAGRFNATLTPTSNMNLGYTDNKTDFVVAALAKARTLIALGDPIGAALALP